MPILRIPFTPFARRPAAGEVHDENERPGMPAPKVSHSGFERVETMGSKASSVLSIRTSKGRDNGDYKMSVVNDSGVYLPPSPTEEKGLWPRQPVAASRSSIDTRSSIGDIDHFTISRESFDSYRRSFDISAKSPVIVGEVTRHSLDSVRFSRVPRSSIRDRSFDREPPTPEESFEDVGLNDEQHKQQPPKKKGFFAKFSDSQESSTSHSHPQGMSRFIPGRKRAQSGQGAELAPIDRPTSSQSIEAQE
ncbi:hypothetical protein MGN70_014386 [Eutypa lata]|uniref:Uncharacterized protein n=1 Tax=Eutypa lata (strain UCR-EL1) TaxID=1287681 RepID=M7SL42_EUTLA|nr:hypothetical protein UCREL1_8107 [Eutypa lata UCREL1]KAI1244513.1 hypothetical protein MGN70_014386 [Eutypa lata]